MTEPFVPSAGDLLRWAETLSAIARTGLAFTKSLYEQERFDEVLKVAADIRASAVEEAQAETLYDEWVATIGEGVQGYVTPKVAVAAVVGNEKGELLLTQRADSGVWLYPVGYADVGYSPSEIAVKEVFEETGIEVEPVALIAVLDGLRLGFARFPLYSMLFHCRMIGGELRGHPLETRAVGFFARDNLPWPVAGIQRWGELAFAAIDGYHCPRASSRRAPLPGAGSDMAEPLGDSVVRQSVALAEPENREVLGRRQPRRRLSSSIVKSACSSMPASASGCWCSGPRGR